MGSVPKNVILDLLPAYISGEASEETRNLVEEFAKNDTEISGIIYSGKIDSELMGDKVGLPDNLEIKTLKRVRKSIHRQMLFVALATALILMIPLAAMMFTKEVNWSFFDFLVMGLLLSFTGLSYVLISRITDSTAYKLAVGIAVLAGFLLIWLNLAVGIIGSENNPANLLYTGVLAVGIAGSFIASFRSRGMAIVMFSAALIQMLVPVIAMIVWRSSMEASPGVTGIFVINAFFAGLFIISGFLFKRSAQDQI